MIIIKRRRKNLVFWRRSCQLRLALFGSIQRLKYISRYIAYLAIWDHQRERERERSSLLSGGHDLRLNIVNWPPVRVVCCVYSNRLAITTPILTMLALKRKNNRSGSRHNGSLEMIAITLSPPSRFPHLLLPLSDPSTCVLVGTCPSFVAVENSIR